METSKINTNNNELLRDVYASQLLVTLAKQAGFEAEPAVLNLATDEEYYTLAIMHRWLILQKKTTVEVSWDFSGSLKWCSAVIEMWDDGNYCPSSVEQSSYEDALEAGLKHAFELLTHPD